MAAAKIEGLATKGGPSDHYCKLASRSSRHGISDGVTLQTGAQRWPRHIGAPYTMFLGGLAWIVGSNLVPMVLSVIRDEARELVLAQGMTSGVPAQSAALSEVEGR